MGDFDNNILYIQFMLGYNQFRFEADGSARARGDFIFYFTCNDFSEM